MKFIHSFLILFFIGSFAAISSAQTGETAQSTQTAQNDNQPLTDETPIPTKRTVSGKIQYLYEFGAQNDDADAIVKITLEGDCAIRVTRKNTPESDVNGRCSSDSWLKNGKAIKEVSNPAGKDQFSIYTIDDYGSCMPKDFPAHIEIINYGTVQDIGKAKAWALRLIRDSGGVCEDITTDVDADIDPSKDGRGSGDEGGFSDFFLTHIPKASLTNSGRIEAKFTKLESALPQNTYKEWHDMVVDAHNGFKAKQYQLAIYTLNLFDYKVQKAREESSISAKDAVFWQKHARRIVYDIEQFKIY